MRLQTTYKFIPRLLNFIFGWRVIIGAFVAEFIFALLCIYVTTTVFFYFSLFIIPCYISLAFAFRLNKYFRQVPPFIRFITTFILACIVFLFIITSGFFLISHLLILPLLSFAIIAFSEILYTVGGLILDFLDLKRRRKAYEKIRIKSKSIFIHTIRLIIILLLLGITIVGILKLRGLREQLFSKLRKCNAQQSIEKMRGTTMQLIRISDPTLPNGPYPISQGTGTFIRDDGVILTAAHVVNEVIEGELFDALLENRTTLSPHGLSIDNETDIALLKVDGGKYPTATISRTVDFPVLPMEPLFALGFPTLDLYGPAQLSRLDAILYNSSGNEIMLIGQAKEGFSGGPIFNVCGEIVGILIKGPKNPNKSFFFIALTKDVILKHVSILEKK